VKRLLPLWLGVIYGCAPVGSAPMQRSVRCSPIGLLSEGTALSRSYRVLARVSSPSQGAPADRHHALALRACELGADAVVEVRDELLANGNGFGSVQSARVWPDDDAGNVISTGLAVVFTDHLPPPAPSPTWEFPATPSGRVTSAY
jgi:hypothetical protein